MESDTKITKNHAANFDKPLMRLRNVICDISVLQTSTFGIECNKKFMSYKPVFYERIGKTES